MRDDNGPFADLVRHQSSSLDGDLIDRLLYGAHCRSQQFQPLEIVECKKRHLVWNAQITFKLRLDGTESNKVVVGKKGSWPVRLAKEIGERNLGFLDGHAQNTNNSSSVRFAHCLLEAGDTFLRVP
jgi:prepilin-type processing-associated H-X9-DG protein